MSDLVPNVSQSSFSGGMNLFSEDHDLQDNEYRVGFNVRNLTGALNCIKSPLQLDAPVGLKQGIYGFNRYLLLFSGGSAYYSIPDSTGNITGWIQIEGFFLNPFVDYIYAQPVPASTSNLLRKLDNSSQINGSNVNPVLSISNITINGTLAGLVCQDGISQPFLIKSDGTVKRTQNFFDWKQDNAREYVPVGLNMAYLNGILFIVSPDRKRLYRSVSGRPLDFVVNVTQSGDKGGNAETVSYAVSQEDITCLTPLNSGELFVGTIDGCFPLQLNYDSTIFQEPTFINKDGLSAGVINQWSFVNILGDYAFIDADGMRSFNAVRQLTDEGRDSVFSQYISSILLGVTQSNIASAAIVYRGHAYFAVTTIYGPSVLVFNMITQKWVSVDVFENITSIKQFAIVKQASNPQLYFITSKGVYMYYGGEEFVKGRVRIKSAISGNAQVELKLRAVRAVFNESDDRSTVTATEVKNGIIGAKVNDTFGAGRTFGIQYPVTYPVNYISDTSVDNIHFNFESLNTAGWKVGAELEWQNNAKLVQVQFDLDKLTSQTNYRQQAKTFAI